MPMLAERLRPSVPVKDWLTPAEIQPTVPAYVRPADWLSLPTVSPGDQKCVILFAVFDREANFAAVNCAAAYTVNWGDGTTDNTATGVATYHNYSYTDTDLNGTECSRGYKQAIITITPQGAANLTTVNLTVTHNQAGLSTTLSSGFLDIRIAGTLIANHTLGSSSSIVKHRYLEQYEWVGTSIITNLASRFYNCSSLLNVVALPTAGVTAFSDMFRACTALKVAPALNTSSVTTTGLGSMFTGCTSLIASPAINANSATSLSGMFNGCSSLVYVGPITSTGSVTSFSQMFQSCSSLRTAPWLNTVAGTNFSSMFTSCANLLTIPLYNTAAGTNFSSMFANCTALRAIPLINTAAGTNLSNMFQSCLSLASVPLLNTGANLTCSFMFYQCTSLTTVPLFNLAACTTVVSMFSGCTALITVPLFVTTAVTVFTGMFQVCSSLLSVPALDTSAGLNFNDMFSGCSGLSVLGTFNVGAGTSFTTMLLSCAALQSVVLSGCAQNITIVGSMGPVALDAIYTALASGVTAKTITVTGNWGTSSDTPSIATAKGWTVTGS